MEFEYPLTHIGNAQRFKAIWKDRVKYIVDQNCWIRHDDNGWNYANKFDLAKPYVLELDNEVIRMTDDGKRNELRGWARSSGNEGNMRMSLSVATSDYATSITEFDASATKINAKNCIVDLESGKPLPHSPDELHLKCVDANYYEGNTNYSRWADFLKEIFNNDTDLINWLQVALGCSILGKVYEHRLFIGYGTGRNGKGTFFSTIRRVLGSYAGSTKFQTLLKKNDDGGVRTLEAVGGFKGKRFITASEIGEGTKFDEALINEITGGDQLTGAILHVSTFEFEPTHTIWLYSNHIPSISDSTDGIWTRLKVIPFNAKFTGDTDIKRYEDVLVEEEADGILSWLVEGAIKYLKDKTLPDDPKAIQSETQSYRDKHDRISVFKRDCLEYCKGVETQYKDIFKVYNDWCLEREEEDKDIIRRPKFKDKMRQIDIRSIENAKGVFFINWKLKA